MYQPLASLIFKLPQFSKMFVVCDKQLGSGSDAKFQRQLYMVRGRGGRGGGGCTFSGFSSGLARPVGNE